MTGNPSLATIELFCEHRKRQKISKGLLGNSTRFRSLKLIREGSRLLGVDTISKALAVLGIDAFKGWHHLVSFAVQFRTTEEMYDVTIPIHDSNGKIIGTAGIDFKPQPDQTGAQVTERSRQIAKEVEAKVKTKEKLFEPISKSLIGMVRSYVAGIRACWLIL